MSINERIAKETTTFNRYRERGERITNEIHTLQDQIKELERKQTFNLLGEAMSRGSLLALMEMRDGLLRVA